MIFLRVPDSLLLRERISKENTTTAAGFLFLAHHQLFK
jgi:hypothetical protein